MSPFDFWFVLQLQTITASGPANPLITGKFFLFPCHEGQTAIEFVNRGLR